MLPRSTLKSVLRAAYSPNISTGSLCVDHILTVPSSLPVSRRLSSSLKAEQLIGPLCSRKDCRIQPFEAEDAEFCEAPQPILLGAVDVPGAGARRIRAHRANTVKAQWPATGWPLLSVNSLRTMPIRVPLDEGSDERRFARAMRKLRLWTSHSFRDHIEPSCTSTAFADLG